MNLFGTHVIVGILVCLNFIATTVQAQPIVVKYPASNQIASAQIPANTSANTPVYFYFISKGNVSTQIGAEVLGPTGLQASVEAAQIKGSALETLQKGNFWKVFLSANGSTSGRSAVTPASSKTTPRSTVNTRATDSSCASLPSSVIAIIVANISAQRGTPVSYEEICPAATGQGLAGNQASLEEGAEIPEGSEVPVAAQPKIEQTYGSAKGIIQKDNCSSLKQYLIRVSVKLDKLAPDVLAQGFEIKSRLQEVEYVGGRPASLKPVSDGKYAPRPLLLMQSLGGGQWVNLVTWAKGKPKIVAKVAASPSIVYWRGLVLVRVVADKLLAAGGGRKVNFELTNGSTIYNVCGKSARVRWRTNGYPG